LVVCAGGLSNRNPVVQNGLQIDNQPDGKVPVSGTIVQKNAPEDWMMVLPVKFSFGEKQQARDLCWSRVLQVHFRSGWLRAREK